MWLQKELRLKAMPRGVHLITQEIGQAIPEFTTLKVGLLHVFIRHTSASLTINEAADPAVRRDFESIFEHLAPEGFDWEHTDEGPDDMPAHVKASLMGSSVSIPITEGSFNLGTWQGVYLCEHRDRASGRSLVLTLQGEER